MRKYIEEIGSKVAPDLDEVIGTALAVHLHRHTGSSEATISRFSLFFAAVVVGDKYPAPGKLSLRQILINAGLDWRVFSMFLNIKKLLALSRHAQFLPTQQKSSTDVTAAGQHSSFRHLLAPARSLGAMGGRVEHIRNHT